MFTGIVVIIALKFFTPYLVYIPKAALAAVIIAAVVFMVELHVVKPMWRTKSSYNRIPLKKKKIIINTISYGTQNNNKFDFLDVFRNRFDTGFRHVPLFFADTPRSRDRRRHSD